MNRLLLKIFASLLLAFSGIASVFASTLPFTDVSPTDDYYQDLLNLYERGIIADTLDNRFNPDSLMNRDDFVAIVVGVSCKNCLAPSFDDIIKYTQTPFLDFQRENKNFYCVAYAKEQGIVEGYTLDASGNSMCENGQSYTQAPFCAFNKITRIESTAVLLRQAGLWSNALNLSGFERKLTLPDTPDNWYGYAQKGIQVGIITPDATGKIRPNENITRREFVRMAANIFRVNLCAIRSADGTIPLQTTDTPVSASPLVLSARANLISDARPLEFQFLSTLTGGIAPYTYKWNFADGINAEVQNPKHLFPAPGKYEVAITGIDSKGTSVSTTIPLVLPRVSEVQTAEPNLSLTVRATNPNPAIPSEIQLMSTATGGMGPYTYQWNFADGTSSTDQNPTHLFAAPGTYEVEVIATDSKGVSVTNTIQLDFSDTGTLTPPVISSTTTVTPAKLAVTIQADVVDINQPSNIQFISTLSGGTGPFTYQWNLGDGTTSVTQNPEHLFDAPGSYDVVLVVTDAQGLTVTSTLNITFTDTGKTVTPGVVQNTATGTTELTMPTAISTELSSQIRILDSSKVCSKTTPVTTFPDSKDTTYTFCGVTESVGGPYTYDWNFAQVQSGSVLTATGSDLTNFDLLSPGTWLVKLTITDTVTDMTSVSIATVNITSDTSLVTSGFKGLSLGIQTDKLIAIAPSRFQFTSTLSGGIAPFIYQWNFADGSTSSEKNPAHLYDIPGGKAVQLTVRDAQGAIAIATVNLVLNESNDSDRDGVTDDVDACPLAVGPITNKGCPVIGIYNGDTPDTSVTPAYIPGFSLSLTGVNGQCRYNYAASVGAIFGASTCTSCPCQYTADFHAPIRSCDVIFPSIMSPNLDTIYSRGKVFEVKF